MGNQVARAAEKLISGDTFGSTEAADLLEKAATSHKLAKSWDKAGDTYVELANCRLKSDNKYEAAQALASAARCYKKTYTSDAISCLTQAVDIFCDIGRIGMAARYSKETAELYELEEADTEKSMDSYEKAADLFQCEEAMHSADQCKQKVAQFAARLGQYEKAIEIYEEIPRHSVSSSDLLKHGVKGHLLNAGICHLCRGGGGGDDVLVAIAYALEKYQDLDPTFSRTREYRLLAGLAGAIEEEDVTRFTDVVKEFDSMTRLDSWRTMLLLRVKEKLMAKELEEDDLT